MNCNICPRKCNIDRGHSVGFCSCSNKIVIAKYMLHHWEEPIISGDENSNGSGAIFFSGCNLKCIYCQNYEISSGGVGKTISTQDLVDIIKKLENLGALNINFVTPTQYTNQIIEALNIYRPNIPIVWNSSGYENEDTIKKLKDYVDIYLVDLKYMDGDLALKLSKAYDYPEVASKAILQMKANQPKDIIENGIMKKGVIIRHLVLPNHLQNSYDCLDWIHNNLPKEQYVSIMAQYTPTPAVMEMHDINRKLKPIEYKLVLRKLDSLNFVNGYYQDLLSADKSYTPDFSKFED